MRQPFHPNLSLWIIGDERLLAGYRGAFLTCRVDPDPEEQDRQCCQQLHHFASLALITSNCCNTVKHSSELILWGAICEITTVVAVIDRMRG